MELLLSVKFLFILVMETIENKFISNIIQSHYNSNNDACTIIVVIDHQIPYSMCAMTTNGLLRKQIQHVAHGNQTRKYTLMEYRIQTQYFTQIFAVKQYSDIRYYVQIGAYALFYICTRHDLQCTDHGHLVHRCKHEFLHAICLCKLEIITPALTKCQ